MPSFSVYKARMRVVLDAGDDDITWITAHGNHIPIKKGENKGEAIKKFFEKKNAGKANKAPAKKTEAKKAEPKKDTRYTLATKIAEMELESKPGSKISVKEYARRLVEGVGAAKGYSKAELENLYNRRSAEKIEKEAKTKKSPDAGFMSDKEYQQAYVNVAHILKSAREKEPKITADLKSIEGVKLDGLENRLKTEESAITKIKREKIEDKTKENWTDEEIVGEMWDLVRYTQVAEADDLAEKAGKTLDELKSKGYKVHVIKNFWLPEVNHNGKVAYRGVNVKLISPDGQKMELQFNTPKNLDIKYNKMHAVYEKQRVLEEGTPEWKKYNDEMLRLTGEFDNPKNIEKLKA